MVQDVGKSCTIMQRRRSNASMHVSPLQGRSILIPGAGTGIGAAAARDLAAAGARVAVVGRRREKLDEVAASIAEAGGRCLPIAADVRDHRQVAAAVDATVQAFGGLDVLIPNAALVDHGPIDRADPDVPRCSRPTCSG
jgi:NADP-dependent 3-hydroxy acid dehydrogenase YdfG